MKKLILLLLLVSFQFLKAQTPQKLNSSEIYDAIQKLNFLGSVLYFAAHPDDENTRLISYFSNKVHARTAYLSLTRGDGGQNLIGTEIRELLGVIRTEELLEARKIDGGEQFFTRANDFGYSKTPEETLEIWNKEEVMADVIKNIRKFQPDIIINRFDHRTSGTTHGHHTTSAILSVEAFDIAGNKKYYPEQLQDLDVWQPKRLFINTSWRFYGSQEKFNEADKSNFLSYDIGTYYPSKGLSNSEIAALSRSQHKSQGFGNTGTRGISSEYIELIKGDYPKSKDIFEGINTTWSRVKGGKKIGKILHNVEDNFDFTHPEKSLPQLIEAYELIQKLKNKHWRELKSKEIKSIILACTGLYLEANTSTSFATKNSEISINLEAINRSNASIQLQKIAFHNLEKEIEINSALKNNEPYYKKISLPIPSSANYTNPYWLNEPSTLGMYTVNQKSLIGLPETPAAIQANFELLIEGKQISFTKDLVFKTNDPVKGEVFEPFAIVPEVSVGLENSTLIFKDDTPKKVTVNVTAYKENLKGNIALNAPENWQVTPSNIPLTFLQKGASQTVIFNVTPPENNEEAEIYPVFTDNDEKFSNEIHVIKYNHIPQQTVILPSKTKVIKLNIQKKGNQIAYIEGAGDVVPKSLRAIGYQVEIIKPSQITSEKLKNFDAVVIGIRAYNTQQELVYKQPILFDYVKNGGTMVVQYNTNHRLKTENIAPYPLHLSRDRVTDEFSNVIFKTKNHPVLNTPNKITEKDFDGWVQERGLYFPDEWSKEFTPILAMKDKNEAELYGSLLVAPYGKGNYVYTGLSFFRELPAGVSGAYKLFANILSLGNDE
ncbi:N-acetylglucosaminyl deacetylase, LmbE family [Mesonia phycicola]|uniref:N-acetylglucosaminyl deacetylase, LmbE family n=1 Tax=Mesonia phycicola TaxID=579105 RepID=A0A1M6BWN4_9FLAO|nr:PIG-L family deacetylase [Mesonia phycicola]SHI53165.1 N-acetylglucosaminyl deacetylase, LmbE family [Mesonia phycicola]